MKKTILSIAIVASFIAFFAVYFGTAQMPTSAAQTILANGSITALGTSTWNVVVDCGKQANVGVMISQVNGAAGVSNTVYSYTRSIDGVTYDTTGGSVTVPSNGTNVVSVLTNLPSFGANYIKFTTGVSVDAATFTTNIYITYGVKISAP